MNNEQTIFVDALAAKDGRLASELRATDQVHTTDTKETRITIILPTNAYFMSGVRDFTMTIVQNMTGFSKKWAFRFQSIVDELCNNAIEHGSELGKEVKVTFVCKSDKSLEVVVEDTGTGPVKMTAEAMYALLRDRKTMLASNVYTGIRGRGLAQIVSGWTDELIFANNEQGGLIVSVKKHLNKSESIS